MLSKKSREGYLLIDNRHAPGVSAEQAAASGKQVIGAGALGVFESATITCSHCHSVFPVNFHRAASYCRKCDHYICDACNGKDCKPLNQVLDEMQNLAVKRLVI